MHLVSLRFVKVQYVLDLQVDGLVRLMEGEHVGPFNLGNPGEFTMLELAEVCTCCLWCLSILSQGLMDWNLDDLKLVNDPNFSNNTGTSNEIYYPKQPFNMLLVSWSTRLWTHNCCTLLRWLRK